MSEKVLRMNAYYYGFDPTGNASVDLILSSVATAGKIAHHTQEWGDPCQMYGPFRGESPIDWIQNAANDAASELARLAAENAKLRACVEAADAISRWWGDPKVCDDNSGYYTEDDELLADYAAARKALEVEL